MQQVEHGYSESDVRERFSPAGIPCLLGEAARSFRGGKVGLPDGGRSSRAHFVIFNQQFLTLIKAGLPILTRWNC